MRSKTLKRSDIVGVSPLQGLEDVTHINEKKLSELLSDQVASVLSDDDGLIPQVQDARGSTIDFVTFTTNGIIKNSKRFEL